MDVAIRTVCLTEFIGSILRRTNTHPDISTTTRATEGRRLASTAPPAPEQARSILAGLVRLGNSAACPRHVSNGSINVVWR